MAKTDWFRKTTWTEADQADFWQHHRRSRTLYNKAQYLRIQAGYLSARYPEASLEMLDKLLAEFPSPPELASTELQRAKIFLARGEIDVALSALEAALAHEKAYPNVITQASSEFGWTVVKHDKIALFEAAEKSLLEHERYIIFPAEKFRFHATLAIIKSRQGNREDTTKHAQAALLQLEATHSGFRYHAKLGLVTDADQEIIQKLQKLAAKD